MNALAASPPNVWNTRPRSHWFAGALWNFACQKTLMATSGSLAGCATYARRKGSTRRCRDDAPVNPVVTHLGEDAVDALQWLAPRMVLRVSTVSKIRNANEPRRGGRLGDYSGRQLRSQAVEQPRHVRPMAELGAGRHGGGRTRRDARAKAARASDALRQRSTHPPNEAVARTHRTRRLDRRARQPKGEVPGGEHGSLGTQGQRHDLGPAGVDRLAGQGLLVGRR